MKTAMTRWLMKMLPDDAACRLMMSQIGRTSEVALVADEAAAMSSATALRFGANGEHAAFAWGSGPLVILVHGWNGRAAQMAPLATALAAQGYKCVAPDITGNGAPGLRATRWHYFLRDIEALTKALATDVFAFIGHSSGGTTMMAARRHGLIGAERYICISSPADPFLSIDSAEERFAPRTAVMNRYKDSIADEFRMTWDDLAAGGSYAGAGKELLLVYAKKDRMVPHSEGDRVHALCRGSSLVKLEGYGHRSVLSAPELSSEAIRFLRPGRSSKS